MSGFRDFFVLIVVMGSLPLILSRPFLGVLMWSWLSYLNPHKLSWGFAREFPFAMLVALATLAALLLTREEKKVPVNGITILLLLFLFWMLITSVTAFFPELAWRQFDKVWKIFLMTFVVMMLAVSRERIQALVAVMALSLAFYGVKGGIFTLTSGGSYAVYGPGGTFIGGNNEIGLALIMTIPLLRYLQLQASARWAKQACLLSMLLCFVSVVGTQSRGAFVAVLVMSLYLFFKSRGSLLLLVPMVAVGAFIYSFMPDSWHHRMSTIETYDQDASALGRINAWKMAFNLAQDRLMGGGFDCFQGPVFGLYAPVPWDVHDAHSIYFEVLGEHGFVGLALFLLLGLSGLLLAGRTIRLVGDDPQQRWLRDLAAMLQVALIGYAAAGLFLGLAYFDFYYALLALIAVGHRIATGDLRVTGLWKLEQAGSVLARPGVAGHG